MIKMFVSDIDGTMMQHGVLLMSKMLRHFAVLLSKMLFFASPLDDLIMKLQT